MKLDSQGIFTILCLHGIFWIFLVFVISKILLTNDKNLPVRLHNRPQGKSHNGSYIYLALGPFRQSNRFHIAVSSVGFVRNESIISDCETDFSNMNRESSGILIVHTSIICVLNLNWFFHGRMFPFQFSALRFQSTFQSFN
jgi:hypothetical protein